MIEIFEDRPIENEFSVRTTNCLNSLNIKTFSELTERTSTSLKAARGFGKKVLQEIRNRLAEHGLSLKDDCVLTKEEHVKFISNIPEICSKWRDELLQIRTQIKLLEDHLLHIQFMKRK